MILARTRLFCLSLIALLLAGCGFFGGHEQEADVPEPGLPSGTVSLGDPHAVRQALLVQYQEWKGVPYRYGGQDRRGVDCSGFTQLTYRERFGVDLPRDSSAQQLSGQAVAPARMAPGDLLFFRTGVKSRHVGMYLGGNNFLHVSEQIGVTLSSLQEDYWARRFREAVRVSVP